MRLGLRLVLTLSCHRRSLGRWAGCGSGFRTLRTLLNGSMESMESMESMARCAAAALQRLNFYYFARDCCTPTRVKRTLVVE